MASAPAACLRLVRLNVCINAASGGRRGFAGGNPGGMKDVSVGFPRAAGDEVQGEGDHWRPAGQPTRERGREGRIWRRGRADGLDGPVFGGKGGGERRGGAPRKLPLRT